MGLEEQSIIVQFGGELNDEVRITLDFRARREPTRICSIATLHGNWCHFFFRFMKFNPVNNMLITIQTYQQYNDSNCVSNFFNMIAAVSLLLNCAYEPCYVKDAINNVINKLVKISLKCQLDCDSQNFLNSVSFHACPKHCNGFNFKHFS